MDLQIIPATQEHIPLISSLGAKTFSETYLAIIPSRAEIVKAYVDENFSREKILDEMSDGKVQFFIVEADTETIGYAKIVESQPPGQVKNRPTIELERIYLDKSRVGKGLGKKILSRISTKVRTEGFKSMWLAVFDQNKSAIDFYRREGFQEVGQRKFEFEWNGLQYSDCDLLFELPLS